MLLVYCLIYVSENGRTRKGGGKISKRNVRTAQQFTNGEVRARVYNGDNKGEYRWVFAGNSHANFQAGLLRDVASMNLGNFDAIIQGTRRNKIKERLKRERNSSKEENK